MQSSLDFNPSDRPGAMEGTYVQRRMHALSRELRYRSLFVTADPSFPMPKNTPLLAWLGCCGGGENERCSSKERRAKTSVKLISRFIVNGGSVCV